MIQIIILLIIMVIWVKSLVDYDGKPHCDQCAGDDCPFPNYDCEIRNELKRRS